MFIDLDFFKNVNDQYGHLEGSRTLHLFGILLENEIGKTGITARYGGDEFVILLPNIELDDALKIANNLRSTVEKTPLVRCQVNNQTVIVG